MDNTVEITIVGMAIEEREEVIALLSSHQYDAFEEVDENMFRAFIKERNFDESQLNTILSSYAVSFLVNTLKEQNWNEVWESNFNPVVVDDFCVIRAVFHPQFHEIEYVINITPKMSFGTGHHVTTFMMIQEMRKIDFKGKAVADFGTGTGVLAILAEKMGSENIIAIDHDYWSIENSKENLQNNESKHIQILKADLFPSHNKFDIILANINKNVIMENAANLKVAVSENGLLLLSGLLKEDETEIVGVFVSKGFIHTYTVEKNNWICILLQFK